jgi:ATP-dependent Lon protease
MEIVQLDGYTLQEKLLIARDHMVGRQLERNGLDVADVTFGEDALLTIVEGHTREAGVRGLDARSANCFAKSPRVLTEAGGPCRHDWHRRRPEVSWPTAALHCE